MSQRFAQISDLHLSTLAGVNRRELCNKRVLGYLSWLRKRRFEHRAEVLDALLRDLPVQALDQVLVTGDLTHVGLPQEFRQAREWLQRLGDPVRVAVVPGNHDAYVAASWTETFALWSDYMGSDDGPMGSDDDPGDGATTRFPSLRVRGDIAFIGVSTACPKPPLLASGTAGTDQLERLRQMLAEAGRKRQFRAVYLHHSPLAGGEPRRKHLTDAGAFREVVGEQGAELVLYGHGHQRRTGEMATCHGTAPVIAVSSASAMGLHGREPAQYNLYTVAGSDGGWRLDVECRSYDREDGVFTPEGSRVFELARQY